MPNKIKNSLKRFQKKKIFFWAPFTVILSLVIAFTIVRKPLYQLKTTVKAEDSFGITPTSNEILSKSLANLGMLDASRPDVSVAFLKNRVSATKDRSSGIVEISVRGGRFDELSKLAKEIANTYVAQINAKAGQLKNGMLKKKEAELKEYKKNLKEQLSEVKTRLEECERKMEEVQDAERGTVERASDLKAQLAELEALRANLLRVYTPAYPEVVRVDTEIAAVKERLGTLPKEPEGRLKLERELKDNQKIYNALREKWDEVSLKKIEELKDIKGGATVISYTEQPVLVNDAARRKSVILFGLIAAFLAGLAILSTVVFLDTSLVSAEEVFAFTHLTIVGTIPYIKSFSLKQRKSKAGLLLEYEAEGAIIEPYRLIYMQIQSNIFNSQDGGKSIFLTSAAQGEGKSIVASNLALVTAKAGKKALIIDTNLTNPAIHLLFGMEARLPGFTDVLNKGVTCEKAIRDMTDLLLGGMELKAALKFKGLDRLKIITAGSPISDATELLRSQKMRELMSELKSQFDYIILDGPSILSSADSAIIASECDATLLVYSAGKTPRSSLKSALMRLNPAQEQIGQGRIALKGVIINQCI